MADGFEIYGDDYDEYYDDDVEGIPDFITDEPKLPNVPIGGLSDIQELQAQMEEFEIAGEAKTKADKFFNTIEEEYGLIPDKRNYDIFSIGKETGSLVLKVKDKFIVLEKKGKPGKFISLGTIVSNINKLKVGISGTNFVELNLVLHITRQKKYPKKLLLLCKMQIKIYQK